MSHDNNLTKCEASNSDQLEELIKISDERVEYLETIM